MILSSRNCVSALIWSMAAWILLMQLYMVLFPPQLVLFDPRSHRRGSSFARLEERIGEKRYYDNLTLLEREESVQASSGRNVSGFLDVSLVLDPVNAPEWEQQCFFPGRVWLDSNGKAIQAHGGGILYVPDTGIFYWYGENKDGPTYYVSTEFETLARVDLIGVSCYSSKDLWLWKYEGLVLQRDKEDESSDLFYKNVLERPKVIYNDRSQQYVMWLHIDNANYTKASLGVAVSSRPEGPFEYLGSKPPHAFESRDMTVFKDEDGTAYIVYSSEGNSALHITPLHDDYLDFRNVMSRVFVDQHREAPAVFKHRGIYYMITSDCTGWTPNTALLHAAESMLGPWRTVGNPCKGGTSLSRAKTFFSQGTFVLPLPALPNTFLFMADRWNSTDLRHSRYVWLPLTLDGPVDEPVEGSFEFPFWWRASGFTWRPRASASERMWVLLRALRRSFHTRKSPPAPPLKVMTKRNDDAKQVLEKYDAQRKEGVTPSVSLVVSALQACAALKDLKKGRRIHSEMLSSGSGGPNIFVQSTLVDMYSKCESMVEARRVFDSMSHRNVVSWTVLISGYVQCGESETGLKLFGCMQENGVSPNARTYVAAIKACAALASQEDRKQVDETSVKVCLERGRSIHSQLTSKGYDGDVFVASSLVDMYCKCGSMKDARDVFDRMPRRELTSWTALILGYSRSGNGDLALDLFSRMQDEGFVPDGRTFLAAINACTSLAAKEAGRQVRGRLVKVESLAKGSAIHSRVSTLGYDQSDLFVASGLVDMYSKCGSMVDARRVFEGTKQRNLVLWTSFILGYAQSGEEAEFALQWFTQMQEEGFQPNARSYVAALKACASLADRRGGKKQAKALAKGREIHLQLSEKRYESDSFVSNALVDMYAKCGSMAEARQVFETMGNRTVVSWNAIIMGYAQVGEGELALELFARMKDEGFVPDAATYVSALKASSSLGALECGQRIYDELCSAGFGKEEVVVNSVISLYGKCGSLVEAQQLFDSISKKDLISWSALIAGYGYQGDTKQAFDLFERMQNEERLQPDGVTFLSILTTCSHTGLVDRGKEFFQAMCSDYAIAPSIEHYTAMVDLLGRANHLDDAAAMVRGMPFEPNATVWMTLLGAARKWKNVKVGKVAFEALVGIDERDGAAYVLMADLYASVGLWEESSKLNAMRRRAKAWKKQGQSWWVDDRGRVHRFGAHGGSKHPQIEEIRSKLVDLVAQIKQRGYVPDVTSVVYDISDEEKEAALCGHSEKLAIGCALINTDPGTSIRIVKNLRVCEDCHKATEIISSVEQRVVVCRDANRYHVFRDGECSCGGFW